MARTPITSVKGETVPHYEVCVAFPIDEKDACGLPQVAGSDNYILGNRKVDAMRNRRERTAANEYQTHNDNRFKIYLHSEDKDFLVRLLTNPKEALEVRIKDYACPGYDLCGKIKDVEPFGCAISNECIGPSSDIGYFIIQSNHH